MYVVNVVIVENSMDMITSFKQILDNQFGINDLGILKFFLGFEVSHSSRGISLCQGQYCLDLLSDAGVLSAKPATTPSEPTLRLCQDVASYTWLSHAQIYPMLTNNLVNFQPSQQWVIIKQPKRTLVFERESQRKDFS